MLVLAFNHLAVSTIEVSALLIARSGSNFIFLWILLVGMLVVTFASLMVLAVKAVFTCYLIGDEFFLSLVVKLLSYDTLLNVTDPV